MNRFDGTAARQLVLIEEDERDKAVVWRQAPPKPGSMLRMLQKDVYDELARRRRRAQVAARHLIENEQT